MESLKPTLKAIIHCLNVKGLNKDLRTYTLKKISLLEYSHRYKSNCIGVEYRAWTKVFQKLFSEAFEHVSLIISASEALNRELERGLSELNKLYLITKPATDFIIRNRLLGDIGIPINHSSEGLGILNMYFCVSLVIIYIGQAELKKPYKAIRLDKELIEVFGRELLDNYFRRYPKKTRLFVGEDIYVTDMDIVYLIKASFFAEKSSIRVVIPEVYAKIDTIRKYIYEVREKMKTYV